MADSSPASRIGVGLLGCGNVGSALVRLIGERREAIVDRTGLELCLEGVAVRSASRERDLDVAASVFTTDAEGLIDRPGVDVVVELIGGIEPARGFVLRALEAGKPVVTANKELIANHGAELFAASDAAGVDLLFEAAVGGGIPLMRPLQRSLPGERIHRVVGIVNGTTNYILTRMTEDASPYLEALAEAQHLGYAERDPAADVEGLDAGSKAAILATTAFGVHVVAGDVYREGIGAVTETDIDFATRLGYVLKLVAVAEQVDGEVAVRVHPAMVPASHPLAGVRDTFNAVFIEGDAAGQLMFYGRGAGGTVTASAVLGDLIDAGRSLHSGGRRVVFGDLPRAAIRPIDELASEYYLHLEVADEPGVLATVAKILGDGGVSIRSMEQEGLEDAARLIFITHAALERDVQTTLHELRELPAVRDVVSVLRVVGESEH